MVEARIDLEGTRRFGAYFAGTLVVLWVIVGVALATIIGFEAATLDDRRCRVPELDSVYGDASWQAWPPGEVCSFGDARFVEPSPVRGVFVVIEVVVGVGLLVAWRRYRNAPDPDWAA